MKVYGDFRQKVDIDPIDVLEKLIEDETGYERWVFEEDGEYFVGWSESAGPHSYDQKEVITKEKYDQVIRLKASLKYLKNKKK